MVKRTRHAKRRTLLSGVVAALLTFAALQPAAAHSAEEASPPVPATVSVDFGAQEGELARPERYNNFGNVTAWPEQRSDDVAFLNEQGLHGTIHRIWISSPNAPAEDNVFNQCDLTTNTCDFSRLDSYITDASTLADSVMVNLNPIDFITGDRPIDELEPMLELIISNLVEEYPGIKHVEAFNEPDWNFHGLQRRMGQDPILQPEELYPFYVPFYKAVNGVNKGLPHADRLQLGGPSLMYLEPKWMEPFLDGYAADTNPRKRLDFLSYHSYLAWDEDYQTPIFYKSDIKGHVESDREVVLGWLKERRLSKHIPSFVTETGTYPGPAFDDPDPKNDYIRTAAGLATFSYWYADQPDTYMFNWCVRHRVEERKDQLVTRTPDGPVLDTFTPYGNMMLMQSKMKDRRVSAVSDAPLVDGDNGVYAMASKDETGAALMVWNWQHIHDASYQATIDMSRLPSELRNGPVRQQMFRIDQTTSNYFTDPATADLQLVDEKIVTPGKTYTDTIDLGPNAIYLILLAPA